MSHNEHLDFQIARVLLVDDNPASRLTLQTVLEAGGYSVDSAASAAEAVEKLDVCEYELVLSGLQMESPQAGLKVIAHARMMDYKPATALVTAYRSGQAGNKNSVLIQPQDVPGLLGKIAELVGVRASRLINREVHLASQS
jgi:CheY-like chemotaxis protein